MKKTPFTSNLFGAGAADAIRHNSRVSQLRQGMQAFGDISSILSVSPREQADTILLRDMLVHDGKALLGVRLCADEYHKVNDADVELALSDGSAFSLAEQFEIGLPVAQALHKELKALRDAAQGARFAATERAEKIVVEYELDKAIPGIGATELKKQVRHLLMKEYSNADYDRMRSYLGTATRNPPRDEVEQAAVLIVKLAEHRLKKAGMEATANLCGYTTDDGKHITGVLDLHDEILVSPMRIDAMYSAHDKNKQIIAQCEKALPILRESEAALRKFYPDDGIAASYKVPSRSLFRAAEQAIETLPNKEPVKGALQRLESFDEEAIMGSDAQLNVVLGARIDNARGMSRSITGITTAYTEGGEGLGKSIRPVRNALSDAADQTEKVKAKLLKGGSISAANQDAIFTFRALDTMYAQYLESGRQELEEIKRIRKDYAGKLTKPQTEMLNNMEQDYNVLMEHIPQAQQHLQSAFEDLSGHLTDGAYAIGRFKVESLVRYVDGFLEAAKRREKKFERFEEKNPRPVTQVSPS